MRFLRPRVRLLRPRLARLRPSVLSIVLMSFGAGLAVGSVLQYGPAVVPELAAAAMFFGWVWVFSTLAQS